ncbi:MAG: aminoacyl-tRNA hydrolase [Candidatus ainarchaeum sp.]|nr:aminoacyl-tRNA hydrolase [Candidatus ainarchaeum sp.]
MELTQYIIMNASLGMGKGKLVAQGAHAAVQVLEKVDEKIILEWKQQGMKKIVLKINTTEELLELFQQIKKELPCTLITDAGKTQIASGSKTCFASGPIEESKGNKYFGKLKLL